MSKMPKRLIASLKEGLDAARMKRASFGNDMVTYKGEEIHVDTFIKERVRLYMHTWVSHPIEKVLAWADEKPPTRDSDAK